MHWRRPREIFLLGHTRQSWTVCAKPSTWSQSCPHRERFPSWRNFQRMIVQFCGRRSVCMRPICSAGISRRLVASTGRRSRVSPSCHQPLISKDTEGNVVYRGRLNRLIGLLPVSPGRSTHRGTIDRRAGTVMVLTDEGLHSLRHGGISKLHGAGCPHSTVELLAGHSAGNVHEKYIHKDTLPLSLLWDGLERLTYPEVVKALEKVSSPLC